MVGVGEKREKARENESESERGRRMDRWGDSSMK